MKQPEDIVKELRDLGSPLADMSRAMPYEVPKGYFEGLHSHISAAISPTEALLSVQTRNMPYEVPEGYFDALPQKMLFAALDADNVADLPRQMPYATPAGYFDQLPAKILEAAKSADAPAKPKTKTISLGRSLRWAAAAILLMGIGFTSYRMLTPNYSNTEKAVAALPNQAIKEYASQNFLETELSGRSIASNKALPALNELEEDEIVDYLDATGWEESLIY